MNDSRRHFDPSSHRDHGGFTTSELEEATGFNRRTIAYYVQEGLLPHVGRHGPRTRYPRFVRDRLLFIRRVREAEEAGELPSTSLAELRTAFAGLPRRVVAAVADGAIAASKEIVAGELGAAVALDSPVAPGVRSAARRQRALEDRLRRVRPDALEPVGGPPTPGVPAPTGSPPSASPPAPPSPGAPPPAVPSPDASSPAVPTPAVPASAVAEGTVAYSRRPPSAAAFSDEGADAQAATDARAATVLGAALAAVSDATRRREKASPQPVDTWMRAEIAPGVELSVRCATDEDRELLEKAAASLRSLMAKEMND